MHPLIPAVQMRNMHLALMLSQGTPMLLIGEAGGREASVGRVCSGRVGSSHRQPPAALCVHLLGGAHLCSHRPPGSSPASVLLARRRVRAVPSGQQQLLRAQHRPDPLQVGPAGAGQGERVVQVGGWVDGWVVQAKENGWCWWVGRRWAGAGRRHLWERLRGVDGWVGGWATQR